MAACDVERQSAACCARNLLTMCRHARKAASSATRALVPPYHASRSAVEGRDARLRVPELAEPGVRRAMLALPLPLPLLPPPPPLADPAAAAPLLPDAEPAAEDEEAATALPRSRAGVTGDVDRDDAARTHTTNRTVIGTRVSESQRRIKRIAAAAATRRKTSARATRA